MKLRKGSIVDLEITNRYYNVVIKKLLKNRIIGDYKGLTCDFQKSDITRVVAY